MRSAAVSASDDNTLKLWDVESGMPLATFTCDGYAFCCAFINDRKLIAGNALGRCPVPSPRGAEHKGLNNAKRTGDVAIPDALVIGPRVRDNTEASSAVRTATKPVLRAGVLTLAADSTRQPCASSDAYFCPRFLDRQAPLFTPR